MRKILAQEIIKAVGGKLISGDISQSVTHVSTDTRKINEGSLFVPLRGERFDGHQFLKQAAEKGARILLVDRDKDYGLDDVAVIKVDDTLKAFHRLAGWYRGLFEADFVAVTGSTGKTTTKNMIASVLAKRFSVLKTPGNYNNQIGLPLTIMQMESSHDIGIVEMGMSSFGEIKSLMDIVRPRVSVITNIGMSHIEKLGSRENILKAKMEIFDGMAKNPMGVLNGDDELLLKGAEALDIPLVFYGIEKGDFLAKDVEVLGENGTEYILHAEGDTFQVKIPLPGRHNVYNSLAAIAVGRIFGIEFDEIIESLRNIEEEKMRLTIYSTASGIKVINDAYNASPDSMKSALEVLKQVDGERKIAVLADMLEMGDYAEEGHRLVGKYVVQNGIDLLITVGNNSRFIAEGARESGMNSNNVFFFRDKQEAGNFLDTLVEKNDVILFKGSRGMRMEELAYRIQERS
jgi:UDP-N-acetylmuramoyl-tripeptide--D-alanyl-D-alanine ligase